MRYKTYIINKKIHFGDAKGQLVNLAGFTYAVRGVGFWRSPYPAHVSLQVIQELDQKMRLPTNAIGPDADVYESNQCFYAKTPEGRWFKLSAFTRGYIYDDYRHVCYIPVKRPAKCVQMAYVACLQNYQLGPCTNAWLQSLDWSPDVGKPTLLGGV